MMVVSIRGGDGEGGKRWVWVIFEGRIIKFFWCIGCMLLKGKVFLILFLGVEKEEIRGRKGLVEED